MQSSDCTGGSYGRVQLATSVKWCDLIETCPSTTVCSTAWQSAACCGRTVSGYNQPFPPNSHPQDCLGKNRVFCLSSCLTSACCSACPLTLPRCDLFASPVEVISMHTKPCCCMRMLEQHRVPSSGFDLLADETSSALASASHFAEALW